MNKVENQKVDDSAHLAHASSTLDKWINPAQYRWMENGIVSKVSLRIAMLNLPRIQKITNFLSKSPFESGRKYLRSTRTENNFQSISCRN
jgi:hypothetical protein